MRAAGDGFPDPAFHDRERASESTGADTEPAPTVTPSNLSPPDGLANRSAIHACRSSSTCTAKLPAESTACCVRLFMFRQTSRMGGSSDSEETALIVMPWSPSSSRAVSTMTPLVTVPMTVRNTALSNDDGVGASLTVVIAPPIPITSDRSSGQ